MTRGEYRTRLTDPTISDLFKDPLPPPKIVRTLWRMQRPTRVIVARIERHLFGRELGIAFEGGSDDDRANVIEMMVERSGTAALEARAEEVRAVLVGKGWTDKEADNI